MTVFAALRPRLAPPTPVDLCTSRELAVRLGTQNKACYRNAQRALRLVAGGRYVEGTVLTEIGLPVEHAWIHSGGGTVIDPTPCYIDAEAGPRRYFAGPTWSRDELAQHRRKRRTALGEPMYTPHATRSPCAIQWISSKIATLRHLYALPNGIVDVQAAAAHELIMLEVTFGEDWWRDVLPASAERGPIDHAST